MNKNLNPLTKQVYSLSDLVEVQIKNIDKALSNEEIENKLSKVRHIIMTGSGDSLLAAQSTVKAFEKFGNVFGNKFEAITPVDVSRYYNFKDLQEPDSVLVIGISASGGAARVKEALKRADYFGCNTMAVTNNADSAVGNEAHVTLEVGTPPGDNSPGLRSYFASTIALSMIAARFGKLKGISDFEDELKNNIVKYTKSYDDKLDPMLQQMSTVANEFKDARGFAFIGDDLNHVTTYFGAATMIEVSGHMCTIDDSESWVHVNYFTKYPKQVPVIFNIDVESNSISRINETLNQAVITNHPVLAVVNGKSDKLQIPKQAHYIEVPKDIKGFEFISVLMNHAPTTILASVVSELINEPYFRGDSFPRTAFTTGNSEIVTIKEANDDL